MRIAIPLSDEATLAEDFSGGKVFALYDIHDDSRAVAYLGRQSLEHPSCGTTPPFLREHGVEVILAHGISSNAVNQLLAAGIVAIKDAPILSADALVAHLVSGTLQATPPQVAGQAAGCGGGGCGHCCGSHGHDDHAHEHEEPAGKSSCCH
jgi:predicted Fe-Mo cluster-binding NifX family protein